MKVQWQNLTDFAKSILHKMDLMSYKDHNIELVAQRARYESRMEDVHSYYKDKQNKLTIQLHKLMSIQDTYANIFYIDSTIDDYYQNSTIERILTARLNLMPHPLVFRYAESNVKRLNYSEPIEFPKPLKDMIVYEVFTKHIPDITKNLENEVDNWLDKLNKEIKNVSNEQSK
jgi:hypothetical protein